MDTRREQLLEVLVFLFLITPSMALSYFAIRQGHLTFVLTASATILRDLALVSLVAFFLWRNGEPAGVVGWTFRNGMTDVTLGIVLFVPLLFAASVLDGFFQKIGLSGPAVPIAGFLTPKGPLQFVLAGVLVAVVAAAEEIIFRGYLILRLAAVTQSTSAAVVLSVFIFSLGHGYEGTAGVATVAFMGLVFALVYIRRQSLVAPIVMHFLLDFMSIVVLPLFGKT